MTRTQKEKLLREEIIRCLLLPQQEKEFWLGKIEHLPDVNVDRILSQFQSKNQGVDQFLNTALAQDADHRYLSELKNLLVKLKKDGFRIEENQQNQDPESFLEKNLTNL